MNRIVFLVDGFNLYHSILELETDTKVCTKWLNISSLCKSYLSLFGKDATLESIYYFTAIPYYLTFTKPEKILRHEQYIECLKDTGICIELGRWKEKDTYCYKCDSWFIKHEEKETDIGVAVKLLDLFFQRKCETVVLITGDTDLTPAIKKCQELFRDKKISMFFPYRRKNSLLNNLVPNSHSISRKQYIRHQFQNPLTLSNGKIIAKPANW